MMDHFAAMNVGKRKPETRSSQFSEQPDYLRKLMAILIVTNKSKRMHLAATPNLFGP